MWKRFALAALLIAALAGTATATVALNKASEIAHLVFQSEIKGAPKGLITEQYAGGPKTFLVLGTDRRAHSTDALDRENPPHSDTILLVRFDPSQGQTTLLSIPRDLLVTIKTKEGAVYANQKINAAYTLGSRLGGTSEGSLLAAETIKREVFPSLKLSGIVDVNFAGFIRLVDTLGCAYVMVDHRYYNQNVGSPETDYTSINLQPGYQKLCYENALDYVRYRHTDSDFVRVARQQDFLRDLREQVEPERHRRAAGERGQSRWSCDHDNHQAVGQHADRTRQADRLLAGQDDPAGEVQELERQRRHQRRLLRHLHTPARAGNAGRIPRPGPRRKRRLIHAGAGPLELPPQPLPPPRDQRPLGRDGAHQLRERSRQSRPRSPVPVLYPAYQTAPSSQETTRQYAMRDEHGHLHQAYVVVWRQNGIDGYYDFEGTNWLNPPLFAHARERPLHGRDYKLVYDGSHIHVIGWRQGKVLYWVTNTLLEDLSNDQMWVIAKSAQSLH